jgi:hypothetical protein
MTEPDLTQELCKSCGLCCDGSILNWTNLRTSEIGFANTQGFNIVRVDHDTFAFTQPCPAYTAPICSIYQNRPHACRSFACKLFIDVENQVIDFDKAQQVVRKAVLLIREITLSINANDPTLSLERLIRYHDIEIHGKPEAVEMINQLRDLLHKFWGVKWKIKFTMK